MIWKFYGLNISTLESCMDHDESCPVSWCFNWVTTEFILFFFSFLGNCKQDRLVGRLILSDCDETERKKKNSWNLMMKYIAPLLHLGYNKLLGAY